MAQKIKTHSGLKKRTKVTGSGKIIFQRSCKNHLLSSKNKRQLKADRGGVIIPEGRNQLFRRMLQVNK